MVIIAFVLLFCANNGFTSGLSSYPAWFSSVFKQVRPGKDGLPFEMVKFRTMTKKIER